MLHRKHFLSLLALVSSLLILPATQAFAGGNGNLEGKVQVRPAKYTAGVVVYLSGVPGSYRPPPRPVKLDQKGMKFVPHVLAVVKGTTVAFHNSDNIRHNVFSPDGDAYNLGTWPKGQSRLHTFKKTGVYHQLCNVHPEMSGIVMVLDNPFFKVIGADGKFSISDVPPGTYTLHAWSEKLPETTQKVTIKAGKAVKIKVGLKR